MACQSWQHGYVLVFDGWKRKEPFFTYPYKRKESFFSHPSWAGDDYYSILEALWQWDAGLATRNEFVSWAQDRPVWQGQEGMNWTC